MIEQNEKPIYVSIPGVMDMFSISEATVHRLLKAGAFDSSKIGRARRIKVASVEEYFNQCRDQKSGNGSRIAAR